MLLRSVLLRDSFMLEKGASMLAYNRSTKHSSVEGMDVGTADGTADGTALGSDRGFLPAPPSKISLRRTSL